MRPISCIDHWMGSVRELVRVMTTFAVGFNAIAIVTEAKRYSSQLLLSAQALRSKALLFKDHASSYICPNSK